MAKEKLESKKRLVSHGIKPKTPSKTTRATASKGERRRHRPPVDPARAARIKKNRKYQNSHAGGLLITLQIPQFARPSRPNLMLIKGRLLARPALFLPLVLVVLLGGILFIPHSGPSKPAIPVAGAIKTEADFKVMTPQVEQASAQKYDAKRDLVTYTTTFSGVRLTVSQQLIPAKFAKDPAALMKTADSIRATQRIDTRRGALYIATNEQAGNQLAVFTTKELLILIQTDRKLDDASWKSFIEQLQSKS